MFDALLDAIAATGIPWAEDQFFPRPPDVDYIVVSLEGSGDIMNGDDEHEQEAVTGSVDLYLHRPDRAKEALVEAALTSVCEGAWEMNSRQRETNPHLIHIEYVFELESR